MNFLIFTLLFTIPLGSFAQSKQKYINKQKIYQLKQESLRKQAITNRLDQEEQARKQEEIRLKKVYNKAVRLYKKKNFFSALDTIATEYRYKEPSKKVKSFMERLVSITGAHYFNNYRDVELRKMNIPSTHLIMAKRNLYIGKYPYVHKRLRKVSKGHRLYPEALLTRATSYYMEKNYERAIKAFRSCSRTAYLREKEAETKQKRYFSVIKETCIINIARIYFKQKNYKQAIRHYEGIPKKSFKWPYTLLELAWSYHYIGDYNRSLGILMTYSSPLLESYFMPEAEALKALNYYKLCLYKDALQIVDKYYEDYAPRSQQLRKAIGKMKRKDLAFFELMFTPINKSEKKNAFLRNLVTQMSKRVKYNLDLNTYYSLRKEILRNNKGTNLNLLRNMHTDLKEQINHYVKLSMYNFINEIHSLSSDMFNLKLEILSKKRDLAYKNKSFNKDRKRGEFKNIAPSEDQDFWTFKNEFWADELGDYSFALSSTCKTRRIKASE